MLVCGFVWKEIKYENATSFLEASLTRKSQLFRKNPAVVLAQLDQTNKSAIE
jgi:hypothetical protein